jgi:(E)-4-hydroxy-3-methylbut-2-enyl-diphosphate synthase
MTRQIQVGNVAIGGGAPVSIQSMLNTKTTDVTGSLAQIAALEKAGCQIVRLAVPDMDAARGFAEIAKASPLPLVADIHFDYKLAIAAAEGGAA